eukprot:SAG31_NODE_22486_length_524_cov_1.317647_1_plen_28_part_10
MADNDQAVQDEVSEIAGAGPSQDQSSQD